MAEVVRRSFDDTRCSSVSCCLTKKRAAQSAEPVAVEVEAVAGPCSRSRSRILDCSRSIAMTEMPYAFGSEKTAVVAVVVVAIVG